jgi:4-hydroxy-tetrahydrodipicolinate synthase
MSELGGLWVTTVAPYDSSGNVDSETVASHVAAMYRAGVRRFVPGGNTGEYFSLEPSEILAQVAAARQAAPEAIVYCGVGGALAPAIALAEAAFAQGADGVMIHDPIHPHLSHAGLEEYYRKIASAVEGRAMLYKRSHRVPDDLVLRLVKDESVNGVKYGVNDLVAFATARAAAPESLWICGTAELWAPFFHLLGADGFTSGLANAMPTLAVAVEQALSEQDIARSMALRELAVPFELLRAEDDAAKNVPAVRSAMSLAGFDVGPPRAPLTPLEPPDVARVEEIWATWQEAGVATPEPEALV